MSTCPRCWKRWENHLGVPAHHCEDGFLFLGERTVDVPPRETALQKEIEALREALREIVRMPEGPRVGCLPKWEVQQIAKRALAAPVSP